MKFITPSMHTVIDVLFCLFMGAAPSLFGFGGVPATICYLLAGGYFVFSMVTNTPVAPIKLVPFKVHGMVEIVAAIGLFATPWIFGFADAERAKNLFLGAGAVTVIVFLLTRWREQPAHAHARSHPA